MPVDSLSNRRAELSLADEFMSSMPGWTRYFNYSAADTKKVEPIVQAYRQALRTANRFVLDNDFVRLATEVSTRVTPHKLLYRLQFSTLPYRTTWIEFDLHVKESTMRALHGLEGMVPNVPQRMGLLLERFDETLSTVTMVTSDSWGTGDIVAPNLAGYIFSLDEQDPRHDRTYNGLTPFDAKFRADFLAKYHHLHGIDPKYAGETLHRVSHGALWGYGLTGKTGIISSPRDMVETIAVPALLDRHGEMAFSRMYDFFEHAGKMKGAGDRFAKIINHETAEFSGLMRWIVCVLAMLNEIPVTSHHEKPTHQLRAGLTHRIKALDYHRLILRVPKTKPVQWIERKLSNVERRHRAHDVREHWRTYLQDVRCKQDEHNWEYDYDEGYRLCGKCMSFGRLIHEHVRGDVSLGWARKDYIVKPNRGG